MVAGIVAGKGFTRLCYAAQFFFGGWFLAHGLNHWLEFFPRPSGSSPISKELIGALNHSGIFIIVKALEVVTGAMLLANRPLRAPEALAAGLVAAVTPDEELAAYAEALAADMLKAQPDALRLTKRSLDATLETPSLDIAYEIEERAQMLMINRRQRG